MRINFYNEILTALHENGKTLSDVEWIGTKDYIFNTSKFLHWAQTFNYNNGYGLNCIPLTWYIVGDNWWLERYEYDGAEWWEYKELPKIPLTVIDDFLNLEDN